MLLCSILLYSILFYSILFYFILFYHILFYSIIFYVVLFYSIIFYYILLYFTLFLSNLLEPDEYGFFEYILSLGAFLAVLLNIGMNGAYPFFVLKKNKQDYKPIFIVHTLIIAIISLIGALIFGYLGIKKLSLAILIAGILSQQMIYSVKLKSSNRVNIAVIFDGGLYLVLGIFAALLYADRRHFYPKAKKLQRI